MPRCNYCDKVAIGYEKERFSPGEVWRLYVCADCAHVNTAVHLTDGSCAIWRKPTPRVTN